MSGVFNFFNKRPNKVPKAAYKFMYKHVTDCQTGEIVPLQVLDVVPGDVLKFNPEIILKASPMVAPTTTEFRQRVNIFYVPDRLTYKDFDAMFFGDTSDSFKAPRITFATGSEFQSFYKNYGRLFTYFGLQQDDSIYTTVPTQWPSFLNLMSMRGYAHIFYRFYLDWRKYSNTALQAYKLNFCRNNASEVTIGTFLGDEGVYLRDWNQNGQNFNSRGLFEVQHTGDFYSQIFPTVQKISVSSGTTIPDLKTGLNLQRFYTNVLKAKRDPYEYYRRVFGTSGSDTITEPVFLGGQSGRAVISEVTATTEASGQPLGSYAGKAWGKLDSYSQFEVPEFGKIFVMYDIVPEINYTGGMAHRLFQSDAMDWFRPELQTIFYDDVKLSTLQFPYFSGVSKDTVTGYSVPFNWLRYGYNRVTGRMASDMKYWNVVNTGAVDPAGISIGRLHFAADTEKINKWAEYSSAVFAVLYEPQWYVESYLNVQKLSTVLHVEQDLMP